MSAAQFEASTTAIADITGDYAIDPSHSSLGFVARHAMVTKVRGQFGAFEGTATIDTATPANSKVDLTIDVSSVDTGNGDRNGHLVSGDFDYLIKVRTRDMNSYRELLGDMLRNLPNIRSSKTLAVMEELKETAIIPIETGPP